MTGRATGLACRGWVPALGKAHLPFSCSCSGQGPVFPKESPCLRSGTSGVSARPQAKVPLQVSNPIRDPRGRCEGRRGPCAQCRAPCGAGPGRGVPGPKAVVPAGQVRGSGLSSKCGPGPGLQVGEWRPVWGGAAPEPGDEEGLEATVLDLHLDAWWVSPSGAPRIRFYPPSPRELSSAHHVPQPPRSREPHRNTLVGLTRATGGKSGQRNILGRRAGVGPGSDRKEGVAMCGVP